jgi:hypothetical protein
MSDEKENALKERMIVVADTSMQIEEIKKQLATSREELKREKRSKELEENRLVEEIVRFEQALAELIEKQARMYQEIDELKRQLHFKN